MPQADMEPAPVNSEEMTQLARCLAIAPTTEATGQLRFELLRPGAWEPLFAAARAVRLTAPLASRLAERGLVPPRPRAVADGAMAPADVLAAFAEQHAARRAAQRRALVDLVGMLNGAGFEPILLKGARALWLDREPQRGMRDFDLLIPGAAAIEANAYLKTQGFAPLPEARERPNRHHLDLLFRDDLPGWIEIHRRGGNPYAEAFLPTREIVAAARPALRDGARAAVLPDAEHAWHGLVHHQFGHSAFARGTVDLKGLHEFCVGYHGLTGEQRRALRALARRDGAGLAALDLWLAIGHDLLALPLDGGAAADALAVWARMRARLNAAPAGYPGYADTIRLGWASDRLRETGARGWGGRFVARARVVLRLTPKIRRG